MFMEEVIVRHFQGRISNYLSNEDKIIFLEKRKLVDMLSSNTHIGSKSDKDRNQKKIMFIIPHLGYGGAEKVVANLSKLFYDYDNTVVIYQNIITYNVNATIILINTPGSESILKKIKNFLIRFYKTKKIKELIKPAIAISFLEQDNIINILTKTKFQKTILTFHSNTSEYFENAPYFRKGVGKILKILYKLAYRTIINKADFLVCASQGIAYDLVKNFRAKYEKIKVIYNPILIEEVEQLAQEDIGSYNNIFLNPVLITAGRLTKPKGQWYILRVFRQLKETYKDLKLVILGEGELKEYLIKLSEELGLRTFVWDRDSFSEDFDVYFLGFQKNPFKFIARSKLFVFPSLWEGFPNALVEAMACGVPVVSSDCRSGPREILAPNTDVEYQTEKPEFAEYGVLMPVFDVKFKSAKEPLVEKEKMWVKILEKLIEDEELGKAYSIKGKQRAEKFSLEKIVEEWKRLIEGV